MHKVGISFQSSLSPEEVREEYIRPLRAMLQQSQAGIYSNYLRQVDPDSSKATEHLLIFEINEFKPGLRLLRLELEKIGLPGEVQFQNLSPSTPGY